LDVAHLIQAAVGPVFLLSGVGVMLGVLTNRLARIVDRARKIEERLEQAPDAELDRRLRTLARRAGYINKAIAMCATSALLVALVVVLLFATAFFTVGLSVTIALLFVASMLMLTGAFVAFLIEVRLATASLRFGPLSAHASETMPRARTE
jgi:hypothetical protein